MFKKRYIQWYYPILMCLGLFFVDASADAKTPNDQSLISSFTPNMSDTADITNADNFVLDDPVAVDIIQTPMKDSSKDSSFTQALSALWQNLKARSKPFTPIDHSSFIKTQETLVQLNKDVDALILPARTYLSAYTIAQNALPQKHMTWYLSKNDRSVKQLFERWSEEAGYQLKWQMEQDFSLDAQAQFNGGLDSAMNAVLSHLESTSDPLVAEFFEGNKVIRVRQK